MVGLDYWKGCLPIVMRTRPKTRIRFSVICLRKLFSPVPTQMPEPKPHNEMSREGKRLNALLNAARAGDEDAGRELISVVYGELHTLAERHMRGERLNSTLRPTALVHEAWLRLERSGLAFENRAHFFGAAGHAMRRVLIDHARHVSTTPRGRPEARVTLGAIEPFEDCPQVDLLILNEAIDSLEAQDSAKCAVVTLRFLLGCSVEETAMALDCSPAKVKKDWSFAKAWLQRFLSEKREDA